MLKKLGIPVVALADLLSFGVPKKAEAGVHFGIGIGVAPPYSYYDPYYAAPYSPYVYPYGEAYAGPAYVEPYTYVTPYSYGGYWGRGWHDRGRGERFDRGRGFGHFHGGGEHFRGGHRR